MFKMSKVEGAYFLAAALARCLGMKGIIDCPSPYALGRSGGNQLTVIGNSQRTYGQCSSKVLNHLGSVGRLNLKPRLTRKCGIGLGERMSRGKDISTVDQCIRSG